ncbi:MAG: LAGLIDADG family homing endonuclease, partial [Halobacteria archaeon]|nr:LAGLIDADG family homing endonuclease [Halobacteria archaeon]
MVHASLPYDEEVFLWTPRDGFGFHEIGEVVENEKEARAVSFDPRTLRVSTHEVTDYITNPKKRIYRVALESGREVLVTKDHNLFTLDPRGGVTRVESEEAEGELVMVPDSLPEPAVTDDKIDLVEMLHDDDDVIVYASDGDGGFSDVDWQSVPSGSKTHYRERSSAPISAVSRSDMNDRDVEIAFKQSDTSLPSKIDITPEFGWILGFYIAEGYARRKQVVFTNKNEEFLERVASWFKKYDASLSWNYQDNGVINLTVYSALWSRVFRELAREGSKKNIPDEASNWSDGVLEAMLDGLIDGDGSRREARDTLYTFNEGLADNVMYLSARLGLLNSAYSRKRETGV